ncbi:MBL fold metallo-hydrolase [Amycolatopsis benzoatilytica]|uniref:MBL fold metallo-hydrolase n=1 Tax=Amycolatopsis benzoatilytica TaxID=346045 RepID=UPI00036660A5|nr:MBL fold metallo-hydrolase [Amycolatopsis benzoatilytica]
MTGSLLTFRGTAGESFQLDVAMPGSRILVGCGAAGEGPAPDAVVLLDATLDQCGQLPRLVADGWAGPVYATPTTAARVPLVLADAAQLLAEEAECAAAAGWPEPASPGKLDVAGVAALLKPLALGTPHRIEGGAVLRFGAAGRAPGASWAELSLGARRLAVVPAVGSMHHPLLALPQPRPACDTLVLTSPPCHGGSEHYVGRFAAAVHRAVSRNGSLLIPVSAAGLTDVVLTVLRDLTDAREIPPLPVLLDSPIGLDLVAQQSGVRLPETLVEHREAGDARLPRGPAIVLAGTETAEYGRVRSHLERMLPDPSHGVLLAGPVPPGTPAARLGAGERQVSVRGRYLPVRAEITRTGDFATTARDAEFRVWAESGPPPETAFLLRAGADRTARTLRADNGWCTVVPADGEQVLW